MWSASETHYIAGPAIFKSGSLSLASAQFNTPGCAKISRHEYENALAETINGLYKAELIHRQAPWKSFEAVELATLTWVDWFNNRRLMEPIGNIPPAEAEARFYAMQETMTMAA